MNRSPSENFIKFLISKREHETDTILRILEDLGLDGITSGYIKSLMLKMEAERPNEFDIDDEGTRAYLKKHQIKDLWFPNGHVQEAYSILSNPQLRSDVQQLLLSPLRVEQIVKRLNDHHQVVLTNEGVAAFGHYFWNKSLLSMEEWIDYLDGRSSSYSSITALRASPDMAETMVPWVIGLGGPPANLNSGVVSRRIRDVAFLKVMEIERQPATLAHSKMMKNYMDVVRGAESEMRQSDVALKEVLGAFEKFRMRKDEMKIPSIEEVAGPNFSKSGEGTDEDDPLAADDE